MFFSINTSKFRTNMLLASNSHNGLTHGAKSPRGLVRQRGFPFTKYSIFEHMSRWGPFGFGKWMLSLFQGPGMYHIFFSNTKWPDHY